ncbi:OmpH family outer membrane protein [Tenacibaculum caenipelagi]|uniref:Periplasmic chaperone for outer membrane proteins Skp n=1 Tax=Tenacibaculum caenipelagi TaxID=1325435 RepID=A0A4R6TCX7_9FLAO|nr:OmpH family outer membrane protein [Tenacibaculum caenipelagi]TDQ25654.1 periplasmic chaperone for outer membrane proteins Skp [Tenacibaculum caenipelagi]
MKLKITFILALFFIGFTSAQTKVGTVNSELIIGKMPQMKGVLQRVENYGKQLDSSFQVKATEYKEKVNSFKAEEKLMTDDDKKARIQELRTLEQEMGKFRQNGTAMMQLQKEQNMRPLYKKLSEVIAEVAKANGYTQILTTTGNEFGYIDERFDITQLVLDKLGIKE